MIYLLGGSGYVGQAYQRLFERNGIAYKSLCRLNLDYCNVATLLSALRSEKPEFLINAAGFTGKPTVDTCETHKAECLFANAVLPGRIAEACGTAKIPWGHVSSGCIYSGAPQDGRGHTEEDPPNFTFQSQRCSFYSGSKALGEQILADYPNVYIWRLRIPFNHLDDRRNYLSKLMFYPKLLAATNSLSELDEFAAATLACWEQRAPFGTYNVTNPGVTNTMEVVELIKHSGVCRKDFVFFESEDAFMQTAAKTPRSNCILDSSKLAATGIRMTEVHEAIARDLRRWQKSA
jgi:dTDP-4-dehydrorhamnose reductase